MTQQAAEGTRNLMRYYDEDDLAQMKMRYQSLDKFLPAARIAYNDAKEAASNAKACYREFDECILQDVEDILRRICLKGKNGRPMQFELKRRDLVSLVNW
jgi:hypothetical protein